MPEKADIRSAMGALAGVEVPVLSVYLNVNASRPENQGNAYLTRLKGLLEDVDAPEDVRERMLEAAENRRSGGRTFVAFVGEGVTEAYTVQPDLPESARYGEPNLAPLALALDENERYGFAVVDAERLRFFVNTSFAGEGKAGGGEVGGFYEELDLDPGSPGPRGGMDQEPTSRRTEANIAKFFNELGQTTRDLALKEGVRHLILAGPKERTAEFRKRLPEEIKGRVAAEVPVPSGESDGEILDRLEEAREGAEENRKVAVLEEIRERGVRGVRDTLEALQEGRVHHAMVLWDLDAEVRWSDRDGLVVPEVSDKESPYTGSPTRVRELTDVLLELASERGARLEFVRSDDRVAEDAAQDRQEEHPRNRAARILLEEFEGLAGLVRY